MATSVPKGYPTFGQAKRKKTSVPELSVVVALGTPGRGEREDSSSTQEESPEGMADLTISVKVSTLKKKGTRPSKQKGPNPLKEVMRRKQQ